MYMHVICIIWAWVITEHMLNVKLVETLSALRVHTSQCPWMLTHSTYIRTYKGYVANHWYLSENQRLLHSVAVLSAAVWFNVPVTWFIIKVTVISQTHNYVQLGICTHCPVWGICDKWNHWILRQPDQVSKKTETMARGHEALFGTTSDRLPSHPTKDGRATDSCFALIGAHQCAMVSVLLTWSGGVISRFHLSQIPHTGQCVQIPSCL